MLGTNDKPHDAFFKALLELPGVPRALIRERLPPSVVETLLDDEPELVSGSFIDETLNQSQSDALFRVRRRGGDSALVYVLVEHKSTSDPDAGLQLLGYVVRILQREGAVVPVFCIVVYNGERSWSGQRRLSEAYQLPDHERVLVDFSYGLFDLGKVEDGALSAERWLRGGLRAMKYATRRGLQRVKLAEVLAGFLDERGLPPRSLVSYILSAYREVDGDALGKAVAQVAPQRKLEMMSIFADEMKAEGRVEGLAEGRAKGAALVLLNLLRLRFGAVSSEVERKVSSANEATVLRWSGLVLTAERVDDVLVD